MHVIEQQSVHQSLSFPTLIGALKASFANEFSMPKRQVFELKPGDAAHNAFAVLPAWDKDFIGVKAFTYFPQNEAAGFHSLYSKIMLFDRTHGVPLALIDGTSVTLWRTAAISALAADFLAREDAEHLVFFGTGNLATYMVKAHLSVRNYKKVSIIGRSEAKVASLIDTLASEFPAIDFVSAKSNESVIASADVISCATGSPEPLFDGRWVKTGTHIDLVGNHHAHARECDTYTVVNASVYLDSKLNVLSEAGEILIPINEGAFHEQQICGELAELCSGRVNARQSAQQITLFKAVGTALGDLVAAGLVYRTVTEQGV